MSAGTLFTARLFVCLFFFVWKAWEDLLLHVCLYLPSFLIHFAELLSCSESPMIRKSPFDNSLICEILSLGWNCLNSSINCLQLRNSSLTLLRMTGIVFLWFGLGRTGVPVGGWKEPGLGWLGSVGEPLALTFVAITSDLLLGGWHDDMGKIL